MKKNITSVLLAALAILWGLSGTARAAEIINDYSVDITINSDATIQVKEIIDYDLGDIPKHGIFRNLPFRYSARGGTFKLKYSDFSVADSAGTNYQFTRSTEGNNVVIKIGDPNSTTTGEKVYVISYSVDRAINYFDSFDELYWNVIGMDWNIPIKNAQVTVHGPAGGNFLEINRHECYLGKFGSQQKCVSGLATANALKYSSGATLNPNEGMTIAVAFSKGLVHEPTRMEKIWAIVADNWIVGLPFLTLGIMFYLWWTRGRDPKGRGTIIAEFGPPDDLTPTEVGIILDERADNKDLSAAIVDLAVRGYLKIKRLETKILFIKSTDYELEKLKDGTGLKSFEQSLLDRLFKNGTPVKLSDLKNKFYKDIQEINKSAYSAIVAEGYFPKNPNTVRAVYSGFGFLILFVFGAILSKSNLLGDIGFISVMISGGIVVAFGYIMPVKTEKGVLAREQILGLKLYLTVAEKDRINFHNAPEKSPEHFEKLLPYAMVLKVEKEWAKQFEGIYTQNPSWYSGPVGMNFTATAFASEIGGFASMTNNTAAAGSSGSGGGGFSGGGGGGGGGGSW